MHVEEAHLGNCLRSDVVVFVVLRTRFQTATAGHATRISVALRHVVLIHPGSGTQVVRPIQLNPGVDALEVIEHLRSVDYQVAHVRELAHRLELDGLIEIVYQSRTRLAHAPVNYHRANAAHLLETIHVP